VAVEDLLMTGSLPASPVLQGGGASLNHQLMKNWNNGSRNLNRKSERIPCPDFIRAVGIFKKGVVFFYPFWHLFLCFKKFLSSIVNPIIFKGDMAHDEKIVYA